MRFLGFIILVVVSSCTVTRQANTNNYKNSLGAQYIADLSSDKMQGRVIGTKGIELAATYLEQQFKNIGIYPYFSGGYRDTFTIENIETYNIIGEIKCEKPTDEYIIISAHYDHIKEPTESIDTIYNGANDNASGVAMVLELAKLLKQNKDVLQKNVMLVLFSGEEKLLKGSIHLAKKLRAQDFNLSYLINFEMIGVPLNSESQQAYLTGYNLSDMSGQINNALQKEFIIFDATSQSFHLFQQSDNFPFYQYFNVPSHTISTYIYRKNYDYYHHVDDEIEALDLKHVDSIIDLAGKAILTLLKENTSIELREWD